LDLVNNDVAVEKLVVLVKSHGNKLPTIRIVSGSTCFLQSFSGDSELDRRKKGELCGRYQVEIGVTALTTGMLFLPKLLLKKLF